MTIEDTKHALAFTEDQLGVIHTLAVHAVDKQILELAAAQLIVDPLDREQTISDRLEDLTRVLEIQKMTTEALILARQKGKV